MKNITKIHICMLCDLVIIGIIVIVSLYLLPGTIGYKSEFIGFNVTFTIVEVIIISVMTKINKSISYRDCEDGAWIIVETISKFLNYWSVAWTLFMAISFIYIMSKVIR